MSHRQHEAQITLDQFLERLPQTVALFVEATRRAFAQGDKSMDPRKPRPEAWWYRDIAAYLNVLEMSHDGGEDKTDANTAEVTDREEKGKKPRRK